jgi:hypothetical protein
MLKKGKKTKVVGLQAEDIFASSKCGDAERDMSTCPDCGMCPYNEE